MGRQQWALVVAVTVGMGSSVGGVWGQQAQQPQQQPPSNVAQPGRGVAAPVPSVGTPGGVSPASPRQQIQVPRGMAGGNPGSGGPAGAPALWASDPGIWDEKSWICWWETNRDAVIKALERRVPAPPADPPGAKPPEQRERAVQALVKATSAERAPLRAAAAVSLGQMREETALKRLVQMAGTDADTRVRGMAWMAVGLVGSAEADKALVAAKPKSEFEQLGVIAGIGMLERPSEGSMGVVKGLIAKPTSPEVGRMALWAIRVHHRMVDHDVVKGVLTQQGVAALPQPMVSEALLALGTMADARDADLLADWATDGRAHELPDQQVVAGGGSYNDRSRQTYILPGGNTEQDRAMRTSSGVSRTGPAISSERANRQERNRSSYPRVSAALALGMAPPNGKPVAAGSVIARNALLANFTSFLDQGGPAYSGASIMSYALTTAQADAYVLRDVVDMGTSPWIGMVNQKSPMRGFAAIGVGLYVAGGGQARIQTRPIGGVVPPGYDASLPDYLDINETLALRFTNEAETPDFRAACAVALGLAGDAGNVQRLLKGAERLTRRDEMLLGYTVLGLALLGEKSAINAAGPLLGGPGKIDVEGIANKGLGGAGPGLMRAAAATQPGGWEEVKVPQDGPAAMGVLGRRAALLGVALLNDPVKTEGLLAGAWGRDRATVQDVARGMGRVRAYKLADPLTQLVEKDRKGAVEAAASLGWVFERESPSRLSRLVVGNNYHQPQVDYVEGASGAPVMLRDFARVGDFYLYSSMFGGNVAAVGATRNAGRK